MKNSRNIAQAAGLALAALVLTSTAVAAPAEGYDPLRQITQQVQKANLLIVLDVTGSMAWDVYGNSVGLDETGNAYTSLTWSNTSSGCNNGLCTKYTYTLTAAGTKLPSRLAIVKNALGNSVTLTVPEESVSVVKAWPALNWTGASSVTTSSTATSWTWVGNWTTRRASPGNPVTVDGSWFSQPVTTVPPQDVVGTNADTINWGMLRFSTDISGSCTATSAFDLVAFDLAGANSGLTTIENALRLNSAGGLTCGGSTNTIAALEEAKTVIKNTVALDTKISCNRSYGVILVTDGMSNQCNPGGDNWVNPCNTGIPQTQCDASGSANDCPSNWSKYAAQKADDLYKLFAGTANASVKVRTWPIGVSTAVGPCELDYIAYMGRTDAHAPKGDAGFSGYDADPTKGTPYVPFLTGTGNDGPTTATSTSYPTTKSNYDGPTGQYKFFKNTSLDYDPANTTYTHGHNAFFATTAKDLGDALSTIIAASAAGDYTTSAPVSGLSVGIGSNVYLASTEFPEWAGRLQAFDASKTDPVSGDYIRLWEASAALSARSTARNVYTWDPANANALVKITTSDSTLPTKLTNLAGTSITSAVIDFILGGDGTGVKRTNVLGPIINSTPAIVGAPSPYFQTNVVNHLPFETTYAARTPLLWVGSDDGMLHAFRVREILDSTGAVIKPGGEEIVALVPPSLLATQAQLYDTFVANKRIGTGQPLNFQNHYYGVANSLRFGDVYSTSWTDYKTVGFITIGPGVKQATGAAVAAGQYQLIAIDITHPTLGDPNYDVNNPVQILWTKKVGDIAGLAVPWAVPALAPVDAAVQPAAPGSSTFRLVIGSGYDNRNTGGSTGSQVTGTNFQSPKLFVLDPVDGSLKNTIDSASISAIKSPTTPVPWVGNQAFADAVFLDKKAKVYQNDNLADLALQADLWGRVWYIGTSSGITFDSAKVGIDAYTKANQPQPIYYPPAASGVGEPANGTATSPGCTLYAFGSGTLYEKSTTVTGAGVGTTGKFIPSLYVAAAKKPYPWTDATNSSKLLSNTPAVDTTAGLFRYPIASLPRPTTDPFYSTTNKTLSTSSQMTGPPFLLVSKSGATASTALFLVYDPAVGCYGYSYVIQIDVKPNTTCGIDQTPYSSTNTTSNTVINVYGAGEGAASGFTIAGTEIVVAKSGIGADAKSTLVKPPVPGSLTGGPGAVKPAWWRELK